MQENKLFEALLDVIPFASYAVDIETFEVVYANKMMHEKMYAPKESSCWKKIYGQNNVCSWCTIAQFKQREKLYNSGKIISSFFDEATDLWFQVYDEIVKWPDGRSVKYSVAVDITDQKEIQASMIKTHTKLAVQTNKLKQAYEKMEILATKDALTKINNRGNFFALAKKIWSKKLSENKHIYVAMLDLDKFKQLNDKYGHQLGDEALVKFTKAVNKNLDNEDIFGRIGGEEFAIVMIGSNIEDIFNKLESIRASVESITLVKDGESIKFTVSIGFEEKFEEESIDSLLERADKRLYEAKSIGRNKVNFRGLDDRK
ncbi:GGDEF domain-containing protein [bacterium]|nr:GGDEF domain-containing protein [bacterium]MBU1884928.1 GGDEF domain-containing protein [bacterium]